MQSGIFLYNPQQMIIIPAIDLKNGQCVRLKQGVMDNATVFSNHPLEMAEKWVKQGAKRLHLVDLDGAFAGKPMNAEIIKEITHTFADLSVQIGGGIRSMKIANAYIEAGVSYLIIGTMAVTHPQFISQLCREFAGKIIISLDANNGKIATQGWAKQTDLQLTDLIKKLEQDDISAIIYTDIGKDGMMQGINIDDTISLAQQTPIDIIASGGITDINDITNLLEAEHWGIIGAITGRAIYQGTLDFAKAQQLCDVG